MPTIPCANRTVCRTGVPRPDLATVLDSDFPILNRSSEVPDRPVFIARYWAENCMGVCYSFVSQEDAELCGFRLQEVCRSRPDCDPDSDPSCAADVVWDSTPRVQLGAMDASWGGDRCVFMSGSFGKTVDGNIVLRSDNYEIVPIPSSPNEDPDYLIAKWVRTKCENLGIKPSNFFHDSTGRGTLGTALARVWSADCNPVEFGGQPTNRPVSSDYWWFDPKTSQRRIKLCSEHYIKFVTELWFSVHYCVQAGQWRNMNVDVAEEFYARIWRMVGDKREIEPKSGSKERPGMKQRFGKSPDLADCAAILLEGARRRGFQISKLSNSEAASSSLDWLRDLADKHRAIEKAHRFVDV